MPQCPIAGDASVRINKLLQKPNVLQSFCIPLKVFCNYHGPVLRPGSRCKGQKAYTQIGLRSAIAKFPNPNPSLYRPPRRFAMAGRPPANCPIAERRMATRDTHHTMSKLCGSISTLSVPCTVGYVCIHLVKPSRKV